MSNIIYDDTYIDIIYKYYHNIYRSTGNLVKVYSQNFYFVKLYSRIYSANVAAKQ